jgi:hypothetical protein
MELSPSWEAASCAATFPPFNGTQRFITVFTRARSIQSISPHPISLRSMCYMPSPSHPPWLDNSNYTWRTIQVMKLLIMQFSPVFLLGPNIFLSILFSNTLSLCSSLYVRDQVSHPYKTSKYNTRKEVLNDCSFVRFSFSQTMHCKKWQIKKKVLGETTLGNLVCCYINGIGPRLISFPTSTSIRKPLNSDDNRYFFMLLI